MSETTRQRLVRARRRRYQPALAGQTCTVKCPTCDWLARGHEFEVRERAEVHEREVHGGAGIVWETPQ